MLRIEGLNEFIFFLNVACSYFSTYLKDIERVVQTRDGDRGNPFPLSSPFKEGLVLNMYVCMVITYSRVWINRVRLPILLVVS